MDSEQAPGRRMDEAGRGRLDLQSYYSAVCYASFLADKRWELSEKRQGREGRSRCRSCPRVYGLDRFLLGIGNAPLEMLGARTCTPGPATKTESSTNDLEQTRASSIWTSPTSLPRQCPCWLRERCFPQFDRLIHSKKKNRVYLATMAAARAGKKHLAWQSRLDRLSNGPAARPLPRSVKQLKLDLGTRGHSGARLVASLSPSTVYFSMPDSFSCPPFFYPTRLFWRDDLPSLRHLNPTLDIQISRRSNKEKQDQFDPKLTITFGRWPRYINNLSIRAG
jgi:Mitochondrial ribosomal protein L51 / S25 / CI-B8 domain